MADPFYEEIINALAGALDKDRFELCAASLLTKEFPTLVPIRGGTDSGMDGATASDGPFLVCTTGTDVIRNLTGSLRSYLKNRGTRRSVVLATSQELSETRRRNLQNRARELGFSLLQIYPRAAIAERLYHEPRWCNDLLSLNGRPSALTMIPLTQRPLIDQALVGRDEVINWLLETQGDRLLIGQPGSGKTSVLRQLALKGWGLFLIDDDPASIANAIRKQQPKVIIVDDAHFRTEILSKLRQLRREIEAPFDIVATSWTGAEDLVAEVLMLPSSQMSELLLLTRDEIVQVIKEAGLGGPVELIREIVDQAEGRPGLAVTLAQLSLSGDVRNVLYGNALSRSLLTAFQRLVGKAITEVLAAFALGGDEGITLEAVSKAIGIPLSELRASLVKLAAGGVIRQSNDKQLSVWPKPLRYVLVRDVFFSGLCDLPYSRIASKLDDKYSLAKTLLGAINRGADIPEITSLLESVNSPTLWKKYAGLGEKEAAFVLLKHSDEITGIASIGKETLDRVPGKTLPLLFKAAIGDRRELGNALNHPLRWVQDWIRQAQPGTNGDAIQRRSILVRAGKEWLAGGGDELTGLRALSLAFNPGFESVTADPGSGNTIHIKRGVLSDRELSQLITVWNEVGPLLVTLTSVDWQDLFTTVHKWAYPETLTNADIPQATRATMRDGARQMVADILAASKNRPGIQLWGRELNREFGLDIELPVEREYETLFPKFETEDWESADKLQKQAVLALAEEWSVRTPSQVASTLLRLESEAMAVRHSWPRWSPLLCQRLAELVNNGDEWLSCFVKRELNGDLCAPFLERLVRDRLARWDMFLVQCLENPSYESIAINIAITKDDLPHDLLNEVLQRIARHRDMVHLLCLRNLVSDTILKTMLTHADSDIAAQAAIGTWWAEPRGQINESIASEWRAALLRTHGQHFYSSEILKSDKSLACEWLIARIDERPPFFDYHTRREISAAASVLDSDQRLAVLQHVPNDGLLTFELLMELADDDLRVCKEILKTSRFGSCRLTFLHGHPKKPWVEKALIALNAGYSAQDIVGATVGLDSSWTGEESNMWQGWIDDFEPLLRHDDPRICSVAEMATAKLKSLQLAARQSERRAAVYGR
jgi:ATPases with chaperone activity, ATP-binding subunit